MRNDLNRLPGRPAGGRKIGDVEMQHLGLLMCQNLEHIGQKERRRRDGEEIQHHQFQGTIAQELWKGA